ncbi:hypothetical protein [Streptomyces sp. NPDC051994]|uniref:hypothetical protein n=1 Tax=unclassified Streptomyces TaxID=2593676 RepID=UPI0034382114
MPVQPDQPQPAPTAPGLKCAACDAPPLVHWQRRLTDTELADYIALEQARRDEQALLADQQQAPPDFGPLPTAADVTRAVHACGLHAIGIDAAALIHAKNCGAPFVGVNGQVMACDCTPEPAAPPEPAPTAPRLPASWGGTGDA